MSEQHQLQSVVEKNKLFNVFIAYNSKDEEQVLKIVEALEKRYGIACCTDKSFPAGGSSIGAMSDGIRQSEAVAVFIGIHGAGKWQGKYEQVLSIHQAIDRSAPLIPVLLPGVKNIEEVDAETGFLDYLKTRNVVNFTTIDDGEALYNLARGILKHKPVPKSDGKPYGILVNIPQAEDSCFLAMPKNGFPDIYDVIIQTAQEAKIQIFQTRNKRDNRSSYVSDIQSVIRKICSSAAVIAVCISKSTDDRSDKTLSNNGSPSEFQYRLPKSWFNRIWRQSQEITDQFPDQQSRIIDFEPDVMYELGLSHALGKQLLIILDSGSSKFLSSYILKDIDPKNFIEYDSVNSNQGQLKSQLKKRLAAVKQDAQFPKVDEGLEDILQVIQSENYRCILPQFWKNFHNILDFGIEVYHGFREIQFCLTKLHDEIEEVISIQRKDIQNKDLQGEINDIVIAWKVYQACDQTVQNFFSDKFTDDYYRDLEASFDFFARDELQKLDQKVRDNYNKIKKMIMEDYKTIFYDRIANDMTDQSFATPSKIQFLQADVMILENTIKDSLIEQCRELLLNAIELIPH